MVIVTILGLYLGTVWILGGNLLTVMITHALYDFAALAYLLRIRPPGGVNSTSTSIDCRPSRPWFPALQTRSRERIDE